MDTRPYWFNNKTVFESIKVDCTKFLLLRCVGNDVQYVW